MRTGEYVEQPAMCQNALVVWSYHALYSNTSRIPSDGCRDLIFRVDSDNRDSFHTSTLQTTTLEVPSEKRGNVQGIRLRPGTVLNEYELFRWLENNSPHDLLTSDQLDESCVYPGGHLVCSGCERSARAMAAWWILNRCQMCDGVG
ncbi:MAG: hypothetical protein AB8B87_09425 [Granulosicoccus sp.]